MKRLLLLITFLTPFFVFAQKDTVYYFGVNGKMYDVERKDIMKKIDFRGRNKIKVKTFKATESGWWLIYTENIKILNDSVYEIRMKGDEFSGKFKRIFNQTGNGIFVFTDLLNSNVIKRTGTTKQKVPLVLDGTLTEHYNNGKIKSVAQYLNNELISNKNWQPDGSPMVEDIYYSVDSEPRFEPGMAFINQQIRKAIKDAEFDLTTVEGKMIVGLVITKDGRIDDVQVVKGISQTLNGILVSALSSLEGAWVPAMLNNREVNCFLTIPINFIYNRYNFDYLEMDKGMMYWVIN